MTLAATVAAMAVPLPRTSLDGLTVDGLPIGPSLRNTPKGCIIPWHTSLTVIDSACPAYATGLAQGSRSTLQAQFAWKFTWKLARKFEWKLA